MDPESGSHQITWATIDLSCTDDLAEDRSEAPPSPTSQSSSLSSSLSIQSQPQASSSSSGSGWPLWARRHVGQVGSAVEGAKDLMLDVWDALLGLEAEDDEILPMSTSSSDGCFAPSEAGTPRCLQRQQQTPFSSLASQGSLVTGLVANISKTGLSTLKSLQRVLSTKDDPAFDLLPRTMSQATSMSKAAAARSSSYDVDMIHGELSSLWDGGVWGGGVGVRVGRGMHERGGRGRVLFGVCGMDGARVGGGSRERVCTGVVDGVWRG